jgi:hypothetical protein
MDEIEERRESWLERRDRTPQTFLLHSGEEGAVMSKTSFAACALVLFTLAPVMLSPLGKVAAGPPEAVSGRMVFDEVADGLRKFHKETNTEKRIRWLEKLAPTRDPRVALLIWEYPIEDLSPSMYIGLRRLLLRHYVTGNPVAGGEALNRWWEANEVDLRRHAKQLPQ